MSWLFQADFGAALKLGQSGSDSQSTSGKPPRVPPIKSHQQRQENSAEIVTTTTTNQQERSRPWRFQSEVSKGITRLSSAFSRSLTESTKVSSVGSNRPVPLPRHRKIRDSNPTVGEAALDSGGSVRRLAAKYSRETSASKYTFQPASQTYSSPHTSPVRQRTKPVEFDSQFRWSQGSKLNEQQNSDLWRPPAKRYLSYVDVVRPQSLAISTSSNSSIGLSQKNSAWSVTSIVDNSQRSYSEQSALNSVETTHKRVAPLTQRRSFISETRRSLKEEELSGKSFAPLSPICGSPSPRTPRTAGSPRNFMFPDETVPTTRVILRPNPKVLRVAPMAATRDYSQASEPDLRLDTTGNRGNLGGSKSSFRLRFVACQLYKLS